MRTAAAFLAVALAVGATSASGQTSQQPTKASGEWPTATPKSLGLNAKLLRDMEAAIRAGEFKKIGSVLIAKKRKSRLRNLL